MAYSRLLRAYYRREKPIPLDPGETFRLVRAVTAVQKKAVSTVLEEFFLEEEDGWHNKRADEEIAKAVGKGMKAKVSAGKRWHPEKDANAMRTHSEGNAKAMLEQDAKAMLPITNSQEPIAKNQERAERQQRSQGSRLPPGWFPSESLKAWAEKERNDLEVNSVIASFRDYWIAVPGSKGLKLDWDATFRNWVRKERQGATRKEPNYDALVARIEAEDKANAAL